MAHRTRRGPCPPPTPENEFCVGDDIPALITDRHEGSGRTASGDEGIYGGHAEFGAGLAGWNTEGRATWAPSDPLPAHPLEGCTAATDGDQVWLVWYTHSRSGIFLTCITPSTGEVTSHRSPVRQPDGFAVRGDRAMLTRRDHDRRTVELTRAAFDGTTWTTTDRRTLRVPGRAVGRCGQGRDGTLWLSTGDTWLRVEA